MSQIISSMKAVIKKENKYLLIQEKIDDRVVWDLPGGKIEYGEEPLSALKREVQEELSLQVEPVQPLGVWFFYTFNEHSQVICNTYLCEMSGKSKIDLTKNPAHEEIIAYHWYTKEQIASLKFLQENKNLEKFLKTVL